MNNVFHLDFETYSAADLRSFGAYRYAADETTEILIMAISRGDEEPAVWDCVNGGDDALAIYAEAIQPGNIIYAHNAQFEAAICKYLAESTFGQPAPPLDNWRCTAAMARRAAIPSSLSQAGSFLGIDQAKDTGGVKLIRTFSIPPRVLPSEDPLAFADFVSYCVQDVKAETEVGKKLSHFELTGSVLESFRFDLRMNDRGVPVNVPALKKTQKLVEEYSARLTERFREITGLNPTQGAKVKQWLRDRGYTGDDMTAPTVENHLDPLTTTLTEEAFEALEIRSKVSYAAVKKIPTMIGAACPDGFVRGSLMWSGAERTHRWAGRIIQPQNFRRPTPGMDTALAYKLLCDGAGIDEIEETIGSGFLEVVASSIRHFIEWPGGDLLQADFSAVEARGAPWLVGGQPKLDMFANGDPIYETMAAKIFGIPVSEVSSEQRFVGKQAELGCAYNMGPAKFRGTCENFKFKPTADMVDKFMVTYFERLMALNSQAIILRTSKRVKTWPGVTDPEKVKGAKYLIKVNHEGEARIAATAANSDGVMTRIKDPSSPTTQERENLAFDNLALRAVGHWRLENPWMVQAWRSIGETAMHCVKSESEEIFPVPGEFENRISFTYKKFSENHKALVMLLPGGHELHYPNAKIGIKKQTAEQLEADKERGYSMPNEEIQFSGKQLGRWSDRCSTYGGKLLENATQAICGDFMAHGAITAEKAGYDAFMLVHDELIGPAKPGQDHETLCKLLSTLPDWATGMELDAEGGTIPYYKK